MAHQKDIKIYNNINETYEIIDIICNHGPEMDITILGSYHNSTILYVHPYTSYKTLMKIFIKFHQNMEVSFKKFKKTIIFTF